MKQDFFEFFLPGSILDRQSAARAIAAGSVAGVLLMTTASVSALFLLFKDESHHERALWLLSAAIALSVVTIGTWKRVIAAPLIGQLFGLIAVAWLLGRREIVEAVILAIPCIGGFWSAVRGILFLKRIDIQSRSS
jgi:hypothetical protein